MGRLKNVSREAQKAAFANMENATKKDTEQYQKIEEPKVEEPKVEEPKEEQNAEDSE